MKRTEAARTIATDGARHTLVVYFTKRTNGQDRRMVCRYFGHPVELRLGLVQVWDMEKGAWRHVNLDEVHEVKVLGEGRQDRAPEAPAPRWASYEEAKRAIDELF